MFLPGATTADGTRAQTPSRRSLAMLEAPLTTAETPEAPHAPVDNADLSLQISLRRGHLVLLVGVTTVVVVVLTLFLSHGTELSRFDRHNVTTTEEKRLLDRYNSYSGNVASALGRPLEVFVLMMAQIVVLWLMTDAVLTFNSSWRVRLTVLALGATVGFLLTNSLNALNVQVRALPPTLVMKTSDLVATTPTRRRRRIVFRAHASESSSQHDSPEPHSVAMPDDSIIYGMPQRAWMKNFLPESLPASTVRMDLLTKATNATVENFLSSPSVIADLLISGVFTNSSYAPFDAVTPFNLASYPPQDATLYPRDSNGTIHIPSARLAGLLPPDPQSSVAQDRAWLLAHTAEFVQRATSDLWQNSSDQLRWTLDVSRVDMTPTMWVDAVTIESEWVVGDKSIVGAGNGVTSGTTTVVQMVETDAYFRDPQIHGYAVCVNDEGNEVLYSKVKYNDAAFKSQLACQGKSNSSMYVFSSGKHFAADTIEYEANGTDGVFVSHVRRLRTIYSSTFARVSWQLQNLSMAYNAACDDDDGCMGLDANLSNTDQRLLVSANAMPMAELETVTAFYWDEDNNRAGFAAQQPFEIVSVRRPTQVLGFLLNLEPKFRAKTADLQATRQQNPRAKLWLGDPLLTHNINVISGMNKTEWDKSQQQYCSAVFDRRILNYVNNHLYMEATLQPTYMAAAFFLLQNGVTRDVLPQVTATTRLQLDGNIQQMNVWLSIPRLNAMLTLGGCVLLIVVLVVALVRLHVMTGTQDHKVTTPHQIARVMVDDTTFPSLLLKRHARDNGVTDDADQFVIHDVAVRSVNAVDDSERA